ncbi:3-hydroxyacyl-CoA dehydrogenase family protein [Rhodococcus wratislaviensis]|uniref:Putative 3-hydroxybutyryl-CoA dehydrogenase n=1 Tax=Rhodococcus wratislaviensis NBRC 100605 TaxID=1219028 RepID=X0PZ00_RHOWR|nr:3-hydroxyacyl-CoA dehydrogenase family protein [Rhodococcus wratislaviensis]GAF43682.1 putative 3-hydroxybutyryl-CoA dehydrogenase [Rhodococcus wratislaviensis NBRC 100605]
MTSSRNGGGPVPAIAVLGSGLMGHGIAQVLMLAGADVRIWDPDHDVLQQVPARIKEHLQLMNDDSAVEIQLADSIEEAVSGAQIVFEAAPENLRIKQELVAQLDIHAPGAVVASNTSVLRISEIALASNDPGRIVGTHWWNPPYLIPVVEIVRGDQTADATVATVTQVLTDAGKTPVTVNYDVPGFVGNRMQFALWREAMSIVEQGICTAEVVDLVARETFGRRLAAIGPLENADFIGLDLTTAIMDYLLPHLSSATTTPDLVRKVVADGQLGAKTGSGLLDWQEGAREAAEQRLLEHLVSRTPAGHAASAPFGNE